MAHVAIPAGVETKYWVYGGVALAGVGGVALVSLTLGYLEMVMHALAESNYLTFPGVLGVHLVVGSAIPVNLDFADTSPTHTTSHSTSAQDFGSLHLNLCS